MIAASRYTLYTTEYYIYYNIIMVCISIITIGIPCVILAS